MSSAIFSEVFGAREAVEFWDAMERAGAKRRGGRKLSLNEKLRQEITNAAARCIEDQRRGAWTAEVRRGARKNLGAMAKATNDLLCAFKRLDAARGFDGGADASLIFHWSMAQPGNSGTLDDLRRLLTRLELACAGVLKNSPKRGPVPHGALNRLIERLARSYESAGGKATASWSTRLGRDDGPFVRFVIAIHGALPKETRRALQSEGALTAAVARVVTRHGADAKRLDAELSQAEARSAGVKGGPTVLDALAEALGGWPPRKGKMRP